MQSLPNNMKTKPTSYLYNFYTKDDGDGAPIIIEIDGFKVQIGINVVILPGFHVKPCKERTGQLTVVGSNCFLGKGESIEEGAILPEGTILQGEFLFDRETNIKVMLAADDLGRKHEANVAIMDCFDKNILHHASIMVNCPFYDEALEMVRERDLSRQIGLHFNVLDGRPFSALENSPAGYDVNTPNSFAWRINNVRSSFFISRKDKKQLLDELDKQVSMFVQDGFLRTYFDSHGNIHFKYPVAKTIIRYLSKNRFRFVRIPRAVPSHHKLYDIIYKNRVIRMYRKLFSTQDYFLAAKDIFVSNIDKYQNKTIEIMVHPFLKKGCTINRRDVSFPALMAYFRAAGISMVVCEG